MILDTHGNRFRKKRLKLFLKIIDRVLAEKGTCHVLDVGGTVQYWLSMKDQWDGRRLEFTLVNMESQPSRSGFTCVVGDARNMESFSRGEFDVVHSNSVIEHVGNWNDMRSMAREIRRLSDRYFVQTPNFWFPYEPHFGTPLFHWLPEPVRMKMIMSRPRGCWDRARSVDEAVQAIESVRLISSSQLKALFPEAELVREKVGFMTKSLIAYRDSSK